MLGIGLSAMSSFIWYVVLPIPQTLAVAWFLAGVVVYIAAGMAGPYTVRALGVPEAGFHFRGYCGAGGVDNLCMRSPFPGTPPGALPAQAAALWLVAAGALAASRFGAQPSLPTAEEIEEILHGA